MTPHPRVVSLLLAVALASPLLVSELAGAAAALTAEERADPAALRRNLDLYRAELAERSRALQLGVDPKAKSRPGIPSAIRGLPFEELLEATLLRQKVIYGVDGRSLIHRVNDPRVLANAAAAVSLMKTDVVSLRPDGSWEASAPLYREAYDLCPNERFRELPVPAFCSGFLVGADLVATAGHCVRTAADLAQIRFVFDFKTSGADQARTSFSAGDVYEGHALEGHSLTENGSDWALVRLTRPVAGRAPAKIRRSGRIPDGEALYVIGHPAGLPMVYAPGANVRENPDRPYFVANLDSYGGNSGSMVVNASTHEVEGILVRGEQDFVTTPEGCNKSLVCPDMECRGEDVTRIGEAAAGVAAPPVAAAPN